MNPSMMAALKSTKPTYNAKPMPKPAAAPIKPADKPMDMSGSFSDVADRINAQQQGQQDQGQQLDVKVDGQDLATPEDVATWIVGQPEILKAVQDKIAQEEQGEGQQAPQGQAQPAQ